MLKIFGTKHEFGGLVAALLLISMAFAAPAMAAVEISYWGPKAPAYAESTQVLVDEFNAANQDIHVTYLPQGQQGAEDQDELVTAVLGGAGPDVIWFNRITVPNMALAGTFMPLDQVMENSSILGRSNFIGEVLKEATFRGQVYGLPITVDTFGLAYNKDMFEAGGLDGNKPPQTWDEMLNYARKLTKANSEGTLEQLGIAPGRFRHRGWLYSIAGQQGVQLISEDGKHASLNQPEMVKGLQWTVDAVELLGGWEYINSLRPNAVQSGRAAMEHIQNAIVVDLLDRLGQTFELGVAPTPVIPGGKPVSYIGGWALSVTNQVPESKMPAIVKFLEYLLAPETQARRYSLDQNGWPATNQALKQVFQNIAGMPNADVQQKYLELTSLAISRGNSPVTVDVLKALENAAESALYGARLPVTEALDQANHDIQVKLDEYFPNR